MEYKARSYVADEWRIVITSSGQVAVIADDDVSILPLGITLVFQAKIRLMEARRLSESLNRAEYMSATCRLKSGESDGVG